MQSNSHSAQLAENGQFSISQNGWKIRCNPETNLNYDSIVVAAIGKDIVAISEKVQANQSTSPASLVLTEFVLSLDPVLICNNLDKHLTLTLLNHSEMLVGTLSCQQLLLGVLDEPRNVERIAPSFGFFGGGRQETLNLVINEVIAQMTLWIDAKDTYLNLSEITFYDQHNAVIPIDESVVVNYSSSKHSPELSLNVLHGQGFHSELEDNPWLKIGFKVPRHIKRIEIGNRNDAFGHRSQHLQVSILNRQREERKLYSAFSDSGLANFYAGVFLRCGLQAIDDCNHKDRRKRLLNHVFEYMSQNLATLQAGDLAFALQFLSSWSLVNQAVEAEQKLQLQILAIYVFLSTRKKLNFGLQVFSRVLSKATDLDFLEEQVNQLRHTEKLAEIQVTKHGIAYKGLLSQNVSDVLETMRIVIDDLQQLGLRPCIAYGTLLGARREGTFITHDDDVDLLVEFDQPNMTKERAFILTEELLQKLDPTKYQTNLESRNEDNLNIHILLKQTNMVIDIFPYWTNDGQSFLHMEKMQIRGIDSGILKERSQIELYDYQFPAPGKVDEFLLERYGSGWVKSNKYHEWPWALIKDEELS